jgi:oligosaccharide repeat unit polymerase
MVYNNIIRVSVLTASCLLCFSFVDLFIAPSARVVLYTVVYWIITLYVLYLYRGAEKLDFFAPIVPSLGLLYLYSISSAIRATATGMTIFNDPVDPDTLTIYYHACILGLYGLCVGFTWGNTKNSANSASFYFRLSDVQTFRKLLIYGTLIFLILFPFANTPFNFINVKSYNETAFASRIEAMAQPLAPIIEVFLVNTPVSLMLCLATLLIFRRRNVFVRSAGCFIFFCFLARALLGGARSAVVLAGILIACFFHYRVKRIGPKLIIAIFLAGYFIVNTMSVLRITSNPMEMIKVFSEQTQESIAFLSLNNSGELLTGQNLMRLISGIRNGESGYSYGATIFSELLVYIPRSLYPDRPLPISELFIETFYPGVRDAGGGYGFFYLMEGYWAFGLLGVFVFMVFYARLVQWVYMYFQRNVKSDFATLWYAFILINLVMYAVRSGIIGMFKAALMYSIPFIIIYVLPNVEYNRIRV